MAASVQWIDRGDGVRLAAVLTPGAGPLVLFLPGYMSDMGGTKALHLEAWAERLGRAFLRFDYSGCGQSEGRFEDGTIRRWAADAEALLARAAPAGELVLVGSSMGGWIMLHLALALGARVKGLVGVAAAPDFVRWGLDLTGDDRRSLARDGAILRPSPYSEAPYRYTAAFVADAEAACLLDARIPITAPVRLLAGSCDQAVPPAIALRLADALESRDVLTLVVKGGDHRLSAPADLRLLEEMVRCVS
jgi:pimeloyl-ACP methyl ester carboxylesterase